jgi:hypothetical protein
MPPGQRSYLAVAQRYRVSPRTVEGHGWREGWQERLRRINAEAAVRTDELLATARVEQRSALLALIDDHLLVYAEKLHRGAVPMVPADLERLYRLRVQVDAGLGEPPEPPPAEREPTRIERSAGHVAAVLAVLPECGALEALGLKAEDPPLDERKG